MEEYSYVAIGGFNLFSWSNNSILKTKINRDKFERIRLLDLYRVDEALSF